MSKIASSPRGGGQSASLEATTVEQLLPEIDFQRMFTVGETSKILALSEDTIREMCRRGELTAIKSGEERGRFRIFGTSLRHWLQVRIDEG